MHILWDFDGTLFDTYPVYVQTLYKTLDKKVPEQEIYKHMKQSFGHTIEFYNMSTELIEQYSKEEHAISPKEKPPFTGVKDVLANADLNVIMTHKSRSEVIEILKFHDMEHYFEELICGDDGYPRKPDSASYRFFHEKHRIDLAVGDRALDLIPTKSLGIKTCYFAYDRDIAYSTEASEVADFEVTSYKELLNYLNGGLPKK